MKGDPSDWSRPSRRSRNQPAILGFCWLVNTFVFCICIFICICILYFCFGFYLYFCLCLYLYFFHLYSILGFCCLVKILHFCLGLYLYFCHFYSCISIKMADLAFDGCLYQNYFWGFLSWNFAPSSKAALIWPQFRIATNFGRKDFCLLLGSNNSLILACKFLADAWHAADPST